MAHYKRRRPKNRHRYRAGCLRVVRKLRLGRRSCMSRTKHRAVTHRSEVQMPSKTDPAPWGSCVGDLLAPTPETPWAPDAFSAQVAELRCVPVGAWPDDFVLELVRRLLALDNSIEFPRDAGGETMRRRVAKLTRRQAP